MDRRALLRWLAAAPIASSLLQMAAPAATPISASDDDWQDAFAASDARWKIAYATPAGDLPPARARVRGRFPDAVAGTLFRIGPAGHELGAQRYHHWFDGDGMAHRFEIERGEVMHHARYVATPKRQAELRAGRRTAEAFGTVFDGVEPPSSPDGINVANTSVLPIGDELLALWEGGSATRLDARTLETRGVKTWRPDLAGMPFSAHPKVDADGTIWNFGVGGGQGLLVLYEIAAAGTLRRADVVPVPDIGMVHDFAITRRHLVFLLPPLVYDAKRKEAGASFLDAHVWRPELGMRVLVIDKRDWQQRRLLALPAGFLFHIGNAWDEDAPGGPVVHVDYVRSDDPSSVFTTNRELMRGRLVRASRPQLTVARLDLRSGRAAQHAMDGDAEFPRIDPRRVGLRHRHVLHATRLHDHSPSFAAIARTDVETGRTQRFDHGPQALVEEHVFVPDGQSAGWVLGTRLDLTQQCTVLSCFVADQLQDGPVAQATLPRALPLGLHGAFVAA